jgi:UMF1 family MFS transporter
MQTSLDSPRVAMPELNNPKTIRAWCMYDWANSVYSLVITTAIFPIYYKAVAVDHDADQVDFLGYGIQNSVLYSYALSFSFLITALLLPLLSGIADYRGNKKSFMKFFAWVGAISCMGLFFFDSVARLEWAIFCSITASIGYSSSLVFYDAFLPEIVTSDRYDVTSAKGYSLGYYGSVILMIICLALIMNCGMIGMTEGFATRLSFLLVGIWWIGFSFISFSALPNRSRDKDRSGNPWANGYDEIKKVWRSLKGLPDLKRFLIAFFFYNMGVQTVMYLATLFGTDVLKMESGDLILTVLLIQIVGAIGAWMFARVSRGIGNRPALLIMIAVWIGVCIAAYFVMNKYQFYGIAFIVGMVMGGIQSLSRATYSKLIPAHTPDTASYFSFYDVTYNVSIVLGTFSYGLINHITGSMRNSALGLGVYFILGMILLLSVNSQAIRKAD